MMPLPLAPAAGWPQAAPRPLPLAVAPESSSESPRYLAQDDIFHVPAYDAVTGAPVSRSGSKRSSSAAPTLRPARRAASSSSSSARTRTHPPGRRPSRGSSAGYSLYPRAVTSDEQSSRSVERRHRRDLVHVFCESMTLDRSTPSNVSLGVMRTTCEREPPRLASHGGGAG